MYLEFLGNAPRQKYFRLGVVSNNLVDSLILSVDKMQGDIDLSEFKPALKMRNKDLTFVDKTGDLTVNLPDSDEGKIEITYVVPDKVTAQKNVDMQLVFEKVTGGGTDTLVWQTQSFNITFDPSINVSNIIASKYPDALKELNERMYRVENSTAAISQYPDKSSFPNIGQANTIYVDDKNNKAYRYDPDDKTYYVIGSNYEDIKIINANGGKKNGRQNT